MSSANRMSEIIGEISEAETRILQLTTELEQTPDALDRYIERAQSYYKLANYQRAWMRLINSSAGQANDEKGPAEAYHLALADCLAALRLNETHPDAYYYAALAAAALDNLNSALSYINKAIEYNYKRQVEAYLCQGSWLYQIGQYQQAIQSCNRIIAQSHTLHFSDFVRSYDLRANSYMALAELQKALFDLGYLLSKMSSYKKDEEILWLPSTITKSLQRMMNLLVEAGQADTVIAFFNQCLPMLPNQDLSGSWFQDILSPLIFRQITDDNCARLTSSSSLPPEFLPVATLIRQIQKRRPQAADLVLSMAYHNFDRKHKEKFEASNYSFHFAATSLMNHIIPGAGLYIRSYLYSHTNNKGLAIKDLITYIAAKPEKSALLLHAYTAVADYYKELSDYPMALTYYTGAMEALGEGITGDDLAHLYADRGWVFGENLKLHQQAIDDYTMAIQLAPGHNSSSFWLAMRGQYYKALGNFAQAERDLLAALQLEPDDEYYREELKAIQEQQQN